MIVRKAFQYRLKLTKKQQRLLDQQLEECRWLYNELLSQRKLAFEELDLSLTKYQQLMLLPELKLERPSLDQLHSQVLQNIVDRLDKSFQHFFRRCQTAEKPGFPRFRGLGRYNSLCYPQSGFSLNSRQLRLSKIGTVRLKMHRPIEGKIKTCTLKKNASGSWDVTFSCEMNIKPLPPNQESIGIDVGLEHFATLSNEQTIANPRFFKHGEKRLAKAQRKLAKLQKGTPQRRKAGKVVAKIHERIRNQRKDFCHKETRKIVDHYQYICLEDLDIKNMLKKSNFKKSITDASWHQFRQFLTYKAAEAGRKLGLVNPAYTTQECFKCGHREKKALSDRMHLCAQCQYRAPRDLNSAQTIWAIGLDGLGVIPRSPRL